MNDWLNNMLKIPIGVARIGIGQIEQLLEENSPRRSDHSQRSPYSESNENCSWPDSSSQAASFQSFGSDASTQNSSLDLKPTHSIAQLGRLDLSNIICTGDSIGAGVGDFSICEDFQRSSFVHQFAEHLGVRFNQPLFESPGIGFDVSSGSLRLPDLGQSNLFAPSFNNIEQPDIQNFSIPGFSISDCIRLKPKLPMVDQKNIKQTLANLILGRNANNSFSFSSQLEKVIDSKPSMVVMTIGFDQFASAALANDLTNLPPIERLEKQFSEIVGRLGETNCISVITTIPSPLDTAAFSNLDSAARILKVQSSYLKNHYSINGEDFLTPKGLLEIGSHLIQKRRAPLSNSAILSGRNASRISQAIKTLNKHLVKQVSNQTQFAICDFFSVFRQLATEGLHMRGRQLTNDFLGGLYSLNGLSLGKAGNCLLGNTLVETLNRNFGAALPRLNLDATAPLDNIAKYEPASGRNWTNEELDQIKHSEIASDEPSVKPTLQAGSRSQQLVGRSKVVDQQYNQRYRARPEHPLQLPQEMEQELSIVSSASFWGDAIAVHDCPTGDSSRFGSCPNRLFGGLAMFGANLSGKLIFRFRPVDETHCDFEVSIDGVLKSSNGSLNAPVFYDLPVQDGQIGNVDNVVCRGKLDLVTGEVSGVNSQFTFYNSALASLASLNPRIQNQPVRLPGEYGSVHIRFLQREDGKLDFLFHGTTFIPLGANGKFPLPIASPDGLHASIPANDIQLHPYLYLSTRQEISPCNGVPVVTKASSKNGLSRKSLIRANSIVEFVSDAGQTCFGDDFHLNHPDLGVARGRSRLAGRMSIQFGKRFGDLIPFSCAMLPPGGLFSDKNLSPLQDVFPGRLRPGMEGHDTVLRFPLRTYRQNDLYLIDDPFDIAVGAVNAFSGEVVGDFLHRAFLGQALFYALVRVEPRTPQGSFQYRGPAFFESTPNGELRFRFNGTVFLPYVEGFNFPLPDGVNKVPIGPHSSLDPYFQVDAIANTNPTGRKEGRGKMQLSSMEERFSYEYSISNVPGEKSRFGYTNHSHNGRFEMTELTWANFMHTNGDGRWQTVTFSGLGTWSLDRSQTLHSASVQISTRSKRPFVSILIDRGSVSNVNTRPDFEIPPLTALDNKTQ